MVNIFHILDKMKKSGSYKAETLQVHKKTALELKMLSF